MLKSKTAIGPIQSPSPSGTPWVDVFASPPVFMSIKDLFDVDPGANASPDKVVEYYFLVSREAISASLVDISNCSPKPPVIKIKSGYRLVFRNTDSKAHVLTSSEWNLEVPANAEAQLEIKGGGVQKYTCDSQLGGILFVQ